MFYGTVSGAQAYFDTRLFTSDWDDATNNDREKSLSMATRAIDRLNFAGDRFDESQDLQFPRGDDETVPIEIEYATYECALSYLGGVSIDQEIRNLGISSFQFNGVQDVFNSSVVNEHYRAGIPSAEAWIYLRPFLRDPRQFLMSRVS